MKYLYLLIDISTILVPLIFSFHPYIRFYKKWNALFPALLITATIFIIWDSFFTQMEVWRFNPDYVTGIYLFKLPLEEILFFIAIPYACIFTFFCIDQLTNILNPEFIHEKLVWLIAALLFITGIYFFEKIYTSVTFISTAVLILALQLSGSGLLIRKAFICWMILMIPFLIVNGILTGTGPDAPVVMYDDAENLGLRIATIPVEDAVYGFELFLLNLFLYRYFESRKKIPAADLSIS
jgi:lycopene cyclase domain-containing protein